MKDLDLLSSSDIEEYQEYLNYYESQNGELKMELVVWQEKCPLYVAF